MNRRRLLTGLLSGVFAAPAIVKASSLMAMSPVPLVIRGVELPPGWKSIGSMIVKIQFEMTSDMIEAFDAKVFTNPQNAQRLVYAPNRETNEHVRAIPG